MENIALKINSIGCDQCRKNYNLEFCIKNLFIVFNSLQCLVCFSYNFATIFYCIPKISFKNCNNVSYFEPMIGGFIVCPIIFFLVFIKKFFVESFAKNKYIFFVVIIMLIISFFYFLLNSYIGSNARFVV